MDDLVKFKNDLKDYAKGYDELSETIKKLNENKVRISYKIDLMEKKGYDLKNKGHEKREIYDNTVETYGTLRDVITECAKCLIFIDEFIDRISNEELIIEEEIDAVKSCMELIEKAKKFNNVMENI